MMSLTLRNQNLLEQGKGKGPGSQRMESYLRSRRKKKEVVVVDLMQQNQPSSDFTSKELRLIEEFIAYFKQIKDKDQGTLLSRQLPEIKEIKIEEDIALDQNLALDPNVSTTARKKKQPRRKLTPQPEPVSEPQAKQKKRSQVSFKKPIITKRSIQGQDQDKVLHMRKAYVLRHPEEFQKKDLAQRQSSLQQLLSLRVQA